MPATVSWYLQDHILLYRFQGVVTLDELMAMSQQARELRNASTADKVHGLYDSSELIELPTNLRAITQAAEIALRHPRQGWIITYNVNDRIINMIASIVTRLIGVPYHTADSQAAALDFLNAVDPQLPPLRTKEADYSEPLG